MSLEANPERLTEMPGRPLLAYRDAAEAIGAHWVDIVVFGKASDEDLATFQHLAQMADTRPVRVRLSGNWARSSIEDMELGCAA